MRPDTKSALLDVAEQATRARGFDGFSFADLSQAVGIRKASVHYHFPTKAALSIALMVRYRAKLGAICEDIAATQATGAARLLAFVEVYRDALSQGKTLCLCVAFIGSRESLCPELREVIVDFRAMMIDQFTAAFALGASDGSIANFGAPKAEAHALLALLEGAHLAARIAEDVRPFDQAVQGFCARLHASIRPSA